MKAHISIALREGKAEAIACFAKVIEELALKPEQIAKIVTSDNSNQAYALHNAFAYGDIKAITEFSEILNKAELKFEPKKLEKLLAAKDKDATPALHEALRKGSAEAIGKYGEIIAKLNLQPDQVVELLAAKDAKGKLGIEAAIEKGNIEAMKAFAKVVLKALTEGKLNLGQAKSLTSGIHPNILQKAANEINHLPITQEINKLALEQQRYQSLGRSRWTKSRV